MGRGLSSLARTALAAVALLACAGPAPATPEADTLRVLSWNIHAGRGMDGQLDLQRIADVIRAARPDLVALQEVDRGTERSQGRDLAAELASLTGMRHVHGSNLRFQGGEFGNAILSRRPLRDVANHPLPTFDDGEPRGVLAVTVDGPGGPFRFLATHFDHRPPHAERIAALARIDSLLASEEGPAVLAGDLNDVPESETLRRAQASWALAGQEGGTYPADSPARRIDYVAYRPAGAWQVVEERVIEEPVASDHRPVLAVLRRRP